MTDKLPFHTLDLVVIAESCPYPEFRGRSGYVIGLVEIDACSVFVDPDPSSVEPDSHVVSMHPQHVTPTGGRAQLGPPGAAIRVNGRGEVL